MDNSNKISCWKRIAVQEDRSESAWMKALLEQKLATQKEFDLSWRILKIALSLQRFFLMKYDLYPAWDINNILRSPRSSICNIFDIIYNISISIKDAYATKFCLLKVS